MSEKTEDSIVVENERASTEVIVSTIDVVMPVEIEVEARIIVDDTALTGTETET